MEEVDSILLLNLKELGVDVGDEVRHLGDLKPEHVYKTCLLCLEQIINEGQSQVLFISIETHSLASISSHLRKSY